MRKQVASSPMHVQTAASAHAAAAVPACGGCMQVAGHFPSPMANRLWPSTGPWITGWMGAIQWIDDTGRKKDESPNALHFMFQFHS